MISFYCKKKEGNKELCPSCKELLQYSLVRLEHCKCVNKKPSCKTCKVHCYHPEMKEKMRNVMRYVGPRMFLFSPMLAFKHFFLNK